MSAPDGQAMAARGPPSLTPFLPQDLRRKAARLVAAKCTLAARVDSFHESSEGKVGARVTGCSQQAQGQTERCTGALSKG